MAPARVFQGLENGLGEVAQDQNRRTTVPFPTAILENTPSYRISITPDAGIGRDRTARSRLTAQGFPAGNDALLAIGSPTRFSTPQLVTFPAPVEKIAP
jgi:hypothetical protein